MGKNLIKIFTILLLIAVLPLNAMKRASRSIFSKSALSLVSPRGSTQSRLKSHYFTDTAKSLQAQRYLTALVQRNHSKNLYYEPKSHKNRSPFNYEERIGPLIAGTALAIGIGSYMHTYKKVYAEEIEPLGDYKIRNDLITASSHINQFAQFKEKLKANTAIKEEYKKITKDDFIKLVSEAYGIDCLMLIFNEEELSTLIAENFIDLTNYHTAAYISEENGAKLFNTFAPSEKNIALIAEALSKKKFEITELFRKNFLCDFILNLMQKNEPLTQAFRKSLNERIEEAAWALVLSKNSCKNNIEKLLREYLQQDGKALATLLCNSQKLANDNIKGFIAILIGSNYSTEFNATITEHIAQTMHIFMQEPDESHYSGKNSLLNHLIASNKENRKLILNSLYPLLSDCKAVFNNNQLANFLNQCNDDELVNHMAQLVKEQFPSIAPDRKSSHFYYNLNSFIDRVKFFRLQSDTTFISMALKNLPLASNLSNISNLLYTNLESASSYSSYFFTTQASTIAQAIIKNTKLLEITKFGPTLIEKSLEKFPHLKKNYISDVESRIDDAALISIEAVTRHSPCNPKIKKWIEESQKSEDFNEALSHALKMKLYHATCQQECDLSAKPPKTPTSVHLQETIAKAVIREKDDKKYFNTNQLFTRTNHLEQWNNKYNLNNPLIKNMINKIIQKEQELNDRYYTFIHGQRNEYLPCEELHTFLQQTIKKISTENQHLLLHVKQDVHDLEEIKKERDVRKILLKRGRTNDQEREQLLFVNWAYFGNDSLAGSSSAQYIQSNSNVGTIKLTYHEIFKLNALESLYPKYEKRLQALSKEFNIITNHGSCIMLAIPKETVNKHIYPAVTGGAKRKIAIKDKEETDDMSIIMETLINEPEKIDDIDKIEFCIPMTYDKKGALNPKSGIKVFAFTAADQEKLDDYYARQKALFEEIKKDIEQTEGSHE